MKKENRNKGLLFVLRGMIRTWRDKIQRKKEETAKQKIDKYSAEITRLQQVVSASPSNAPVSYDSIIEELRKTNEELCLKNEGLNKENAGLRKSIQTITGIEHQTDNSAKRPAGRPPIQSANINLALDLDTFVAIGYLGAANIYRNRTRFINDILREWIMNQYPETYNKIRNQHLDLS